MMFEMLRNGDIHPLLIILPLNALIFFFPLYFASRKHGLSLGKVIFCAVVPGIQLFCLAYFVIAKPAQPRMER